MQNKRKVWWKALLYPLTIIIGILFLLISPIFFNCPWNWLWFYGWWFIISFILFTFRKKRKKWIRKTILKIILIINNNTIKKGKIFFIDKETNLTKENF